MKYPVILKAFISEHLLSLLDVIVFFSIFRYRMKICCFFLLFNIVCSLFLYLFLLFVNVYFD